MTLIAGGAVVVIIGIILAITLGGRGGGPSAGNPGDAVKGYLEALSRGDAEAALSYSDDQPASREFLTDEILKKQIEKAPISDIRILGGGDKGEFSFGRVHVAAKFGERAIDANISVKQNDGKWRLETAAVKLAMNSATSSKGATSTLTVFGKPIADQTIYVFPIWVDFGSSNPYVSAKVDQPDLDDLNSLSSGYFYPKFELNEAGKKAVTDTIAQAYASCEKSNQLSPPAPCPIRVDDRRFVDGTATWGRSDLKDVQITYFDESEMTVRVSGEVVTPLTAQDRNGGTREADYSGYITGKVDISKTPPTLKLR